MASDPMGQDLWDYENALKAISKLANFEQDFGSRVGDHENVLVAIKEVATAVMKAVAERRVKLASGYAYTKNILEQLKQHRRKCKKLGRLVGEGRVDIEILRQALKDIVAQAEVHGFWNAEQKMAEAALDKVEALWKERAEAAKKRRGEE